MADAPVLLGVIKDHAAKQQPKNQAFIRSPQRASAVALIRSGQADKLQAVSGHDEWIGTGFMRADACNA